MSDDIEYWNKLLEDEGFGGDDFGGEDFGDNDGLDNILFGSDATPNTIMQGKIENHFDDGAMRQTFGWLAKNNPKTQASRDFFKAAKEHGITMAGMAYNHPAGFTPSDDQINLARQLMGKTTNANPSSLDVMGELDGHYHHHTTKGSVEAQLMNEFQVGGMRIDQTYQHIADMYMDKEAYNSDDEYQKDRKRLARRLSSGNGLAPQLKEVAAGFANQTLADGGSLSYIDALPSSDDLAERFKHNPPMLKPLEFDKEERQRVAGMLKEMAKVYNVSGSNPNVDMLDKTGLSVAGGKGWAAAEYLNNRAIIGEEYTTADDGLQLDGSNWKINKTLEQVGATSLADMTPDQVAVAIELENNKDVDTSVTLAVQKPDGRSNNEIAKAIAGTGTRDHGVPIHHIIEPSKPVSSVEELPNTVRALLDGNADLNMSLNQQGSQGWLDERKDVITATSAKAAIQDPDEVVARKFLGEPEDAVESIVHPYFDRGHEQEAKTKANFANILASDSRLREAVEKYGGKGINSIADVGMITNKKYPGLGVSPDGVIGNMGFEHKSLGSFLDIKNNKDHSYYHQMQMQMMVSGQKQTLFYQTFPNKHTGKMEYAADVVHYDEDWEKEHGATIAKAGRQLAGKPNISDIVDGVTGGGSSISADKIDAAFGIDDRSATQKKADYQRKQSDLESIFAADAKEKRGFFGKIADSVAEGFKKFDKDPNTNWGKGMRALAGGGGGVGRIAEAGIRHGAGGMSNAAGAMMMGSTNPIIAALGALFKVGTAGYDKLEGYYHMDKDAQGMGRSFDAHFKDMSMLEKLGVQGAEGYANRTADASLGMAAGFMDEAVNMTVASRGALTLDDIENSTSTAQLTALFVRQAKMQGKTQREILASGRRMGLPPELVASLASGNLNDAAVMRTIMNQDQTKLGEVASEKVTGGQRLAEETIYQPSRDAMANGLGGIGDTASDTVTSIVDSAKNAVKKLLPSTADSVSGVPDSHQNVLQMIGQLEASGNIDAVHRKGRASSHKGLSNLTIAEVMALQKSGEFGAAGLYQITRGTLGNLVKKYGDVNMNDKFDKGTQDKLASLLINERSALRDHLSGRKVNPIAAQNALADIWMAFPKYGTGKSKYEGYNTNKALTTDKEVQAMLARTGAVAATVASVKGSPPAVVKNEIKLDVKVVNNADSTVVTARQDGRPIATQVVSSKSMGSTG